MPNSVTAPPPAGNGVASPLLMTLRNRLTVAAAATACAATVAFTGVAGASAATPRQATFQTTYPVAARVCEKIAGGRDGVKLRRDATQALADCTALQTAYAAAQPLVAQEATIKAQITAMLPATSQTCTTGTATFRTACVQTRDTAVATRQKLGAQHRTVRESYAAEIKTARLTFWAAVTALPAPAHTLKGTHTS